MRFFLALPLTQAAFGSGLGLESTPVARHDIRAAEDANWRTDEKSLMATQMSLFLENWYWDTKEKRHIYLACFIWRAWDWPQACVGCWDNHRGQAVSTIAWGYQMWQSYLCSWG